MLRYLLRRLVSLALSLVVASLVIFFVIEVDPRRSGRLHAGDQRPARHASPRCAASWASNVLATPQRYLAWVGGMLHGDFGTSYTYRTPVAEMIGERLWVSLPLALYALALSTLIAFPAGIFAAARRGRPADAGGDGGDPARRRGAELLVRDAAGAALRDQPALVRRRRLSRLGQGLAAPGSRR